MRGIWAVPLDCHVIRDHLSGFSLCPITAPIKPPNTVPPGPNIEPTAAPSAPPATAFSAFADLRFAFDNGARVFPFLARALVVEDAPFDRLQLMQAG